VALAAIVGDKTIAELAALHDVHPNQITEWKRRLVDRAADVFGGESNTPPVDLQILLAKIVGYPRFLSKNSARTIYMMDCMFRVRI